MTVFDLQALILDTINAGITIKILPEEQAELFNSIKELIDDSNK
jgi:hypothetical protein